MKKYLFLFLLLLSSFFVVAQSHQPVSVNNGGGKATTPDNSYRISYTIGQPFRGNYATDTAGSYQITHGYQQHIVAPTKFNIGEIPEQNVGQNNEVELFIESKDLGPNAVLSMMVHQPPFGEIYFSSSTGYFKYQHNILDTQPFEITFTAFYEGNEVSQTVTFTPEIIIPPVVGEFFGYSAGEFSVTENGGSAYFFPITVSPGTAGMQPDLCFTYSSQGDNGIMGPGWTLGGLSVISRSPSTYAQDMYIDPVDFEGFNEPEAQRDKFSLDGERLIVVNGGGYGVNGTQYYTEQNTFANITSNAEGGVTTSFEVKTKSGLIKEYGGTDNSSINVQGRQARMFWALNKITDTKGNYITFTYANNGYTTGEYYPTEINYTGNENKGLQPYNTIKFEYEDRKDSTKLYISGSKVTKSKRLKSVKVLHDDLIVREYRLEYTEGIYSKLISIQEFGKGGVAQGEKFEPTKFVWQANTYFNLSQVSDKISAAEFNNDIQVIPGDWNKDGFSDVLLYNKTNGSNNWFINDGKLVFTKYTNKIQPASITGGEGLYFGDFNGNGYQDIMWWNKSTGDNRWFLSSVSDGGQFSYSQSSFTITNIEIQNGTNLDFGDFNGDGLTDFFWYNLEPENGNNSWYLNETYITGNLSFKDRANNLVDQDKIEGTSVIYTGDWNADGLADVMAWDKTNGDNYWFLNEGLVDYKISFKREETPIRTTEIQGGTSLYFGDWNADGITDVMWYDAETGKNHWYVNKGDYTFETYEINPIPQSTLKHQQSVVYLNDWNADGYTDLMWNNLETGATKNFINKGDFNFTRNDNIIKPNSIVYPTKQEVLDEIDDYITENYGTVTQEEKDAFIKENYNTFYKNLVNEKVAKISFTFGDWKGTGHAGLLWYNKETGKNHWYVNEVSNTNLIQQVQKGNGAEINISYKSLVDTTVYKKYHNPVYPEVDFISPLQVVSSYNTSNGKGGVNNFSYLYEGGKVNLQGRGFRGFQKTIITDEQTGIKNISHYERDFKFVGNKLKKNYQLLASGDTVSVTEYTNDYKEHNSSYFSYYPKQVTRKFEIDGSLISTTVIEQEYDDYGNPVEIITDYGGGFSDIVTNSYINDVDNWYLGRLTHTSLTRIAPDQENITRVSEFEYDLEGDNPSGMLVKEVIHPGNDDLRITKTYTHDDFGNIASSTVTGNNGTEDESRTTTTNYSTDGRFVLETINPLGHTVVKEYDPLLGNVISVSDANELHTYYQFDNFGRNVRVTRPDGTESVISLLWSKDLSNESPPPNALYATHIQSTGKPLQILWYDTLGREVRKETEGFDGTRIYQDKVYNNIGDLIAESDPYFKNGTIYWTQYVYDDFNRLSQITKPGDRVSSITYEGLKTTYTNELGQKNAEIVDVTGKLIRTINANNDTLAMTYNSVGNLTEVIDPLGNIISLEYDIAGNRIKIDDPDLKVSTFVFNAFGQMVSTTDARNNTIETEYDLLGRITKQTEPEGESEWYYDTEEKGIGKLAKIVNSNSFEENYKYDNLGRIDSLIQLHGSKTYAQAYDYDDFSNLSEMTYPSGFKVGYQYNTLGYLESVVRASDNFTYWTAQTLNAKGQIEAAHWGNGVNSSYAFNNETGFIESIQSSRTSTIQNLSFEFDAIGNLKRRSDEFRGLEEVFGYDNLNRLTNADITNGTSLVMEYDRLGNITYKSDVGTYTYGEGNAGSHAVTAINGEGIENVGFMTSLAGNIQYTSFRKAKEIKADAIKVEIAYNYNHARKQMKIYDHETLVKTKVYVGSLYEEEIVGDTVTQKCHIKNGSQVIAVYSKNNFGQERTHYLHRDHIGSVQTITNQNGAVVQTLSYDAWGRRRNAETWEADNTISAILDRGFTGHEHMDLVALINMNGRIYDPVIGRFTSADPFIQEPTNIQSLNRYSYVFNNPLSYTDPSGYWSIKGAFKKIGGGIKSAGKWAWKHKKAIAIVAVTVASGFAAASLATTLTGTVSGTLTNAIVSGAGMGFGMSFSSAALSGASLGDALKVGLKQALIGGISAGLTFGVGEAYAVNEKHITNASNVVQKSVAHGIIQGTFTELQGGKFEHGFLSGAVTSVSHINSLNTNNHGMEFIKSTVIGGTVSKVGGGKFCNGAMSGAMISLYNFSAGYLESLLWGEAKSSYNIAKKAVSDNIPSSEQIGDGLRTISKYTGYGSCGAAATAAVSAVVPLTWPAVVPAMTTSTTLNTISTITGYGANLINPTPNSVHSGFVGQQLGHPCSGIIMDIMSSD